MLGWLAVHQNGLQREIAGKRWAIILDLKGIGYSFRRKLNSFDTLHLTPFKVIELYNKGRMIKQQKHRGHLLVSFYKKKIYT